MKLPIKRKWSYHQDFLWVLSSAQAHIQTLFKRHGRSSFPLQYLSWKQCIISLSIFISITQPTKPLCVTLLLIRFYLIVISLIARRILLLQCLLFEFPIILANLMTKLYINVTIYALNVIAQIRFSLFLFQFFHLLFSLFLSVLDFCYY